MFDPELFINSIKARPALYNTKSKVYRMRLVTDEYWTQIANIMKMDVKECRTVWAGFRSSYARHLQFMRKNKEGPKDKLIKPWYLAGHMSFLDEYMKVRPKRQKTNNPNRTATTKIDDNDNSTTSFSNIEYKSENRTMDENLSLSSIKSEEESLGSEIGEETTISVKSEPDEETNEEELTNLIEDLVKESEAEENPKDDNFCVKKSEIETTDEDQKETQPAKRIKKDTSESSLNAKEKSIQSREESVVTFFESLLLDIGKLSDRNLRLFKEDVLKDMNKYLDEQEIDG
ncbi:uncharacterized protein LOC129915241 [Episyrphus balteatus]|uniref:uncharacterized protein LOC129915241 n=1 Tax=Episyrphus balteatus TaxID=286459 RepID=UPI002486242F|nr:uncharacterized protein LOC129915241 [Episyrphus balteatus]